jgi:hypothetical protein
MTERDYINAKELGHVCSAINCLNSVIQENSVAISKENFKKANEILFTWQTELFKIINLEDSK